MMDYTSTPSFASRLAGVLVAIVTCSHAFAQSGGENCGRLYSPGQYGPYDFRTDTDKLPRVLDTHFTPEMEALIRGNSNSPAVADIDYTLRAIPNMPRALFAMVRAGLKEKTDKPKGSNYTIDCWFQRATQFRPDDSIVRMIYSTYLATKGRVADANKQLEIATHYAADNAFTHYNIGLSYYDLKNYDMALVEAHRAIALGWTDTTDLPDLLRKAGKWAEPANATTAPAGAASAPQSN